MTEHSCIILDFDTGDGFRWSIEASAKVVKAEPAFVRNGECLCPGRAAFFEDEKVIEVYEVSDFNLLPDQGFRMNFVEVDGAEQKLIALLQSDESAMKRIGEMVLEDWLAGERRD